eukprot:Skav200868  [mRNA]  locus=scaffold3562:61308:71297:- [translate_table: standard]
MESQDALSKKSRDYWDYEKLIVKWGVLDDYEVTHKIGRGKYSHPPSEVFTGFHVPTNKKCAAWSLSPVLGTDLLEEYLDAYDLELELEVEQRLGQLAQKGTGPHRQDAALRSRSADLAQGGAVKMAWVTP